MRNVWSSWYPWIRNHPDYLVGITSVYQGEILVARMLIELCSITYDEAIRQIAIKELRYVTRHAAA